MNSIEDLRQKALQLLQSNIFLKPMISAQFKKDITQLEEEQLIKIIDLLQKTLQKQTQAFHFMAEKHPDIFKKWYDSVRVIFNEDVHVREKEDREAEDFDSLEDELEQAFL